MLLWRPAVLRAPIIVDGRAGDGDAPCRSFAASISALRALSALPFSGARKVTPPASSLAVAGVLVHLLSAILLPFVAGMAVAYFLDPVADRLEEKGFSRALATTVITIGFFAAVVGVIAVLLPLLQHQVVGLIKLAPEAFSQFRIWLQPFLADLQLHFPSADSGELKEAAGKYGSKVIQWISNLLGEILSGGLAFLNVMSLILITTTLMILMLLLVFYLCQTRRLMLLALKIYTIQLQLEFTTQTEC